MDKYGLVGHPLGHSFSRRFFTDKFNRECIDAEYVNFDIDNISLFRSILVDNPELKGLNVTIPYKELVMDYLDYLDDEARIIGAVNVIKVDQGTGKLTGYNSDVIGFQKSIEPFIDKKKDKKALILGTGGSSKAVDRGLHNLGIEAVHVSRTEKKEAFTYQNLSVEIMSEYTVIVNSTPLGTYPNVDQAPDIPYELITNNHLLFDLVYNPEETKFLKLGKRKGARIKNGYEMLELQAIAGWEIWNN